MNGELSQKTMGLADSLRGRTSALNVSDIAELLSTGTSGLQARGRAPHPLFQNRRLIRFDPLAIAIWLRQKMAPAPLPLQPGTQLLVRAIPDGGSDHAHTRGNARL